MMVDGKKHIIGFDGRQIFRVKRRICSSWPWKQILKTDFDLIFNELIEET